MSVTAKNNWGVYASSNNTLRPASVVIEFTLLTFNGTGIEAFGSAGSARVSNSTITHNEMAAAGVTSGSVLSRQNNTVQQNVNNGTFTGTFSGS